MTAAHERTVTIKPAQHATTLIELPDGSTKTVAALLRDLEHVSKVTRIDGVEYKILCRCDGSNHELGMGCT